MTWPDAITLFASRLIIPETEFNVICWIYKTYIQ